MNLKNFCLTLAVGMSLLLFAGMASAQEPPSGVEAIVAPDFLYVRQGPGTATLPVGTVTRGTVLVVSGREDNLNDEGSWVFVTQKGGSLSGWVLVTYLFFPENYNIGVLPLVSAAGSAAPSTTTSTAPSTTAVQTAPLTTVSVEGGLTGVTKDFVNLREGPELTFAVIRQIPPNQPLTFVGRNSNGVWLQVVTNNGEVGWVFYQLVRLSGDRNSLPIVGADNVPVATTTTASGASAAVPSSAAPISFGVKPGSDPSNDGRLNLNIDLGFVIVYCVDRNGYTNSGSYAGGGILVYQFTGTPRVVLFASEAEINAVGSNPPGGRLIKVESGYSLGRTEYGEFLLAGADANGAPFTFLWRDCQYGRRAQ